MANKVLILGKTGQLGRALAAQLGGNALALSRAECDFLDTDFLAALEKNIGNHAISAVINAVAYTQIDKAESDGPNALRVNTTAPGELATWCKRRGLPLLHFSTDYVFDGKGNHSVSETGTARPINVYGKTKLAGERAVAAQNGDYLIIRTSWLYDAFGANFFTAIYRSLLQQESLDVVRDQTGTPTYAPHLAKAALAMLFQAMNATVFPSGIYHLCNAGETTRYDFAQAIFTHMKASGADIKCKKITPIATKDYPSPAQRPLNSRLDCTRARETFGIALPPWETGLDECFAAAEKPI